MILILLKLFKTTEGYEILQPLPLEIFIIFPQRFRNRKNYDLWSLTIMKMKNGELGRTENWKRWVKEKI
jgi:hypothetical protein